MNPSSKGVRPVKVESTNPNTLKSRARRAQRRALGLCYSCPAEAVAHGLCRRCGEAAARRRREAFGWQPWRPGSAGRKPQGAPVPA